MKISSKLTIEIDGAKFIFEPQGLNVWTTIQNMKDLDLLGQIDVVLAKLVGIEGATLEDGTPLTAEHFKSKPDSIPADVYTRVFLAWIKNANRTLNGEAEEGKSTAA